MSYIGTETLLEADDEYTSNAILANGADKITGAIFADQGGTLFIEQSQSGEEDPWDISTSHTISASTTTTIEEDILLPLIRVRYTNGSDDQAEFRINTRLESAGPAGR